ncbi:hypothetical protein HU200_039497 [Digitaria exilis]|uniref:BTB domain-containing protein n=1 Tax=Digitaria exilis TaxID=1010633 RepID=A0A835EHG1_9POAL|nr:hypothetical protein HU200_039497 [Digitaria exilis]
MLCSGFLEFDLKLDYSETNNIGQYVSSENFHAGEHTWRIICYPRGDKSEDKGDYVSLFLVLVSNPGNVKAVFDAFLLNRDGTPSSVFMCGVIVVPQNPMPSPMPPSDIGIHLGHLLDCAIGSDVSFIVNGEQFPAHRAVLAARSPVFQAELFGAMADATMPSITVQDIEPAAFKVMLRFMYTDELIENISVDSVGSILVCAETYDCPELKIKCLDFFAVEKNFKEAVFTDGFAILVQKFPSLAAELRRRVVNL